MKKLLSKLLSISLLSIFLLSVFLLILIITASCNVFAQEVIITKETSAESNLNDILEIKINILNGYQSPITLEISEKLPDNILLIDPQQVSETKYYNGITVNFLKWTLTINPGQVSTITYKIKPTQIGTYTLPQTTANDISTGNSFTSNTFSLNVKCLSNNICDVNENYLTCPLDCESGSNDGICDNMADSICDPDCESEPDCDNSFNSLYIILIVLGVIIFVIIITLILRKMHR